MQCVLSEFKPKWNFSTGLHRSNMKIHIPIKEYSVKIESDNAWCTSWWIELKYYTEYDSQSNILNMIIPVLYIMITCITHTCRVDAVRVAQKLKEEVS